MERADRLYQAHQKYVDEVCGPDYKYELAGLRRLSEMPLEDLPLSIGPPEEFGGKSIARIFPEKADYLGEAVLRQLFCHGLDLAKKYSLTTSKGAALLVWLTLTAGHCFDQDPLYPWIQKTLQDARFPDPNARADRLYARAMTYLRHMFADLE
jgi:hypothetical protein